ncbi:MAG TPA: hypothetical protein VFJ51_05575, partial [Nitrososphaeraceae archaeon]|nr:hypothetical protein [Nitrososphaeraceae archaeon]
MLINCIKPDKVLIRSITKFGNIPRLALPTTLNDSHPTPRGTMDKMIKAKIGDSIFRMSDWVLKLILRTLTLQKSFIK